MAGTADNRVNASTVTRIARQPRVSSAVSIPEHLVSFALAPLTDLAKFQVVANAGVKSVRNTEICRIHDSKIGAVATMTVRLASIKVESDQ